MKTSDQVFESKVNQDAAKLKKDLAMVLEDGSNGLGRLEARTLEVVTRASDDLTTWVEDETAHFSRNLGNLAGDALDTVAVAANSVQHDVDLGLAQYNAKIQNFADKAPGGFSQKAARYPWVTLSIALAAGFLMGYMLNPPVNPWGNSKFERIPKYFSFFRRKMINQNVFESKWKKIRGRAQGWWGKLSDDDLDKVDGNFDKLIGLLQIKYGYTERQAEEEYEKRTK